MCFAVVTPFDRRQIASGGVTQQGIRRRPDLPAEGPGSKAPIGLRLGAFVIDSIVAILVARIDAAAGVSYTSDLNNLLILAAFALMELVLVATAGQTIGMRMTGLRVVRVRTGLPIGWRLAAIRTILLLAFIPAILLDADNRGLHDRAADAVMIRE